MGSHLRDTDPVTEPLQTWDNPLQLAARVQARVFTKMFSQSSMTQLLELREKGLFQLKTCLKNGELAWRPHQVNPIDLVLTIVEWMVKNPVITTVATHETGFLKWITTLKLCKGFLLWEHRKSQANLQIKCSTVFMGSQFQELQLVVFLKIKSHQVRTDLLLHMCPASLLPKTEATILNNLRKHASLTRIARLRCKQTRSKLPEIPQRLLAATT